MFCLVFIDPLIRNNENTEEGLGLTQNTNNIPFCDICSIHQPHSLHIHHCHDCNYCIEGEQHNLY